MDVFKTAEDILNEKGSEILSIGPDALLSAAIELMTKRGVGAILIRDGNDYVGIWTERDLLNKVLVEGFDLHTAKIRDHMKTKLIYAQHVDDIFRLLDTFLGRRVRHLPIQRDGQFIGMLSAGDVGRAALQQRSEDLERMRDIVKLDYYDEWRWKKKHK
jgi:signal-transduction protein with cAMP-binding, CBS, and nucleotidyltransferase domain